MPDMGGGGAEGGVPLCQLLRHVTARPIRERVNSRRSSAPRGSIAPSRVAPSYDAFKMASPPTVSTQLAHRGRRRRHVRNLSEVSPSVFAWTTLTRGDDGVWRLCKCYLCAQLDGCFDVRALETPAKIARCCAISVTARLPSSRVGQCRYDCTLVFHDEGGKDSCFDLGSESCGVERDPHRDVAL